MLAEVMSIPWYDVSYELHPWEGNIASTQPIKKQTFIKCINDQQIKVQLLVAVYTLYKCNARTEHIKTY